MDGEQHLLHDVLGLSLRYPKLRHRERAIFRTCGVTESRNCR
jgi:hypothetical protein